MSPLPLLFTWNLLDHGTPKSNPPQDTTMDTVYFIDTHSAQTEPRRLYMYKHSQDLGPHLIKL